jgi:hypothetical protein
MHKISQLGKPLKPLIEAFEAFGMKSLTPQIFATPSNSTGHKYCHALIQFEAFLSL